MFPQPGSPWYISGRSLLIKALAIGLAVATVVWMIETQVGLLNRDSLKDTSNNIVIGMLAGFAAYCLLLRKKIISEVNHHVRNSLVIILSSSNEDERRAALARIDWTLKRTLLGNFQSPA